MQKNRSIKPKIRWKAKKLPDVWQGQHQVFKVQQALIYSLIMLKKPGNTLFSGLFLYPKFCLDCSVLMKFERKFMGL
ncbi:hypothetical protein DXA92_13410 [Agathobaculum butyriciproducens]|nr:hypothetical protein DXA94_13630 [Agathobaculum butyriciproducens]RGC58507.1 hypothetical protein DXA92_13410 [Agathobaculum butyriciproducens]